MTAWCAPRVLVPCPNRPRDRRETASRARPTAFVCFLLPPSCGQATPARKETAYHCPTAGPPQAAALNRR